MPLLLAFPVGALIGATLAWMARAELARSETPLLLARPFVVSVGLGVLLFGPIIGYFTALHGDWAYVYLVRTSRVPSAVDLLLVALAALTIPAGFALAARWAVEKRGTELLRVMTVVAILVLAACALTARRLGASASFTQFHGGFGVAPIGQSPLGRSVLLSWAALALGFAWTSRAVRAPRAR